MPGEEEPLRSLRQLRRLREAQSLQPSQVPQPEVRYRWRAAMTLGGITYGDPVQVDAAAVGRAVFGRSVMDMGKGEGLFVELVEPADLQDFLERLVRSEARVLPVRISRGGHRHRSWESIAKDSRLELQWLAAPAA